MFHDSSDKMNSTKRENWNNPLPFENLPVGKSFIVKFGDMQENSLRTATSQASKKYNKLFRCIKHKELKIFEIGCLSDSKSEVTQVYDSSDKMK